MNEKQSWNIIKKYYEECGPISFQIESFDNFINFGLQDIIDQEPPITLMLKNGEQYEVAFKKIHLDKPNVTEEDHKSYTLTPYDARIRDLTYSADLNCDIQETIIDNEGKKHIIKHNRIGMGKLPIMLNSCACIMNNMTKKEKIEIGECPNDPGGYFIIKGKERVLVGQIRGIYNKILVFKNKDAKKFKYTADIRSMSDETKHSVSIKAHLSIDDRTISFILPCLKDEPIYVGIVFKAMGYTKDQDIIDLIGLDAVPAKRYIKYILRDSFFIRTQNEALEYIGQRAKKVIPVDQHKKYAWQVVDSELFPHLGIVSTIKEKAIFLGSIVNKLLSTVLDIRKPDSRDNYANKRVEVSGILMCDLFRTLFKRWCGDIKDKLEKKKQAPDIISTISRMKSTITKEILRGFTSGNWGVFKNSYVRAGVSQILDRMTYASSLSHLHRFMIPIGKQGKNIAIRQIHASQYGMLCPAECFALNTPILLWNGKIKLAKNINIGDLLINEVGEPIKVKSLCRGSKRMYRIKHAKNNFNNYTVTDNHILTLKIRDHKKIKKNTIQIFDKKLYKFVYKKFNTRNEALRYKEMILEDNIVDITIHDYLKLPSYIQKKLYMFKCGGINWDKQKVPLAPYILGSWLSGVSLPDFEVDNNDILNAYNLIKEKHIPLDYIVNSRRTRLELLAGFVDSQLSVVKERHIYIFPPTLKLVKDLLFLAQTLGFSCTCNKKNLSVIINGHNLYQIPTKNYIDRKRKYKYQNYTNTKFKLVEKEKEPFIGWQVEGSGRFLLADCTVTHNTPEGKSTGIVLNSTIMTKVSRKIEPVIVKEVLMECKAIIPIKDIKLSEIKSSVKVILNGSIIGLCYDDEAVVKFVRQMRRYRRIDTEVSVSYDDVDQCIYIYCDEGRFLRPLLVLKKNKLMIKDKDYTWNKLLSKNIIEYIDNSESESSTIAMYPSDCKMQINDYCEINPVTMFGVIAAMIPFPDHSQSPRNCYQSNMGKQALGIPTLSYKHRADTILYVLHYPQRPLVSTKISDILGYNEMPSGINAIVAIASYTGQNQEDSIIFNQSAIERGLFVMTQYKTIDDCEKKRDSYSLETICKPPLENTSVKEDDPKYFKRKRANYSMLDENGVIKRGMVVKKGIVIIGKVLTKSSKDKAIETRIDISRVIQEGEEGIVDKVYYQTNPNGYILVKIVIRKEMSPIPGDKFASRAAQKGTIGAVLRQEDMPFTASGIVPDIIINPHCIPSRMTINQLIECVLGKIASIDGKYKDASPFTENSNNIAYKIAETLEEYGMKKYTEGFAGTPVSDYKYGYETMRSGFTGETFEAKIFIGPTYYQRLKHNVLNKMHSRSRGARTMITRQPTEGRSQGGGLRFGEMERDCMIAHGSAQFLRERLFTVSDKFSVNICMNPKCGSITASSQQCNVCGHDHIEVTNMPYVTKLLIHELNSMGLKMRITTEK